MSCSTGADIFGVDANATTANVALVALEDLVHGDTWTGIAQVGPITFAGVPPTTAMQSVSMTFRHAATDIVPGWALVSGTPGLQQGQLTITDASSWIFTASAQPLPLHIGTWHFDMQITDAAGTVLTLIMGTIRIVADYTQ